MGFGSGGMGEYGGGMGTMPSGPQPPEVWASRRRLIDALESIHFGFNGSRELGETGANGGLAKLIPEEQKLAREQMNELIKEALAEVNDRDNTTLESYAKMLQKESKAIRKLAENLGAERVDGQRDKKNPEVPGFPGQPGGFGVPFGP